MNKHPASYTCPFPITQVPPANVQQALDDILNEMDALRTMEVDFIETRLDRLEMVVLLLATQLKNARGSLTV